MARMHARKRGKSGSTRPISKRPPAWLRITPEEVEGLIVKYAKEGYSPSMIGVLLRDQHGVPLVKAILGKTIKQVLKENGLYPELPEDLANLVARARRMYTHLQRHRSDRYNIHRLQLVESKIRRLAKYYKERGEIPKDWELTYA